MTGKSKNGKPNIVYINLMQWLRDFEAQAAQNRDVQRIRLANLDRLGWRLVRAVQYDEAKAEFERGIHLAQQLNEHWWGAIFEYAVCYVCQQDGKYQEMLERAVKLVARMSRKELENHPYRAAIHQMLVRAYAEIDICGYSAEMRQAMDFIETNIPMDKVTHMSIYYRRINLHLYFEEYEQAHDLIQEYLSVAQDNYEQQSVAERLLSQYYFAVGDVQAALEAQQQCSRSAGIAQNMRWEALAIGLQSMLLGWLGRTQEAYTQYNRGKILLENLKQHELVPALAVGYHIGLQQDAEALQFSQQAIEVARASGSLDRTFEWHIARGYLLNRLQLSVEAEMQQARALLPQFRTPDCHLKKIVRVEQGRCYAHDWQVNERGNGHDQSLY